ncbi:PLP-dependent aminotransferase family protein [Pseudactinotalea sp.]|uniref:MocR-like pyridoxine biosynthesis transcription factor PdxR n=1 Tax=Pseudactinotalea sp. TaxID=1926260 RepID=UPI003B3A5A02
MVGSDFLALDIGAAPARGRAAWLATKIRAAIDDGRLRAGDRLPATRVLAADLGVSRGVVVAAYERLAGQGLVLGRTGGGTAVTTTGAALASGRADRVLLRRPAASTDLDLSPGVPDLSAFPRSAWLRAEKAVLAQARATDLGYGDVRGHVALRTALSRWLARTRGVRVEPDGVVVVAGVAQALALLWRVLGARGVTEAAVEDPGSRGAREQLESWGIHAVGVPVDADGARIERIPDGVTTVMLTPAHQFPVGVVLAPERRRALLDRLVATGGLLVEDDYDAEHRYDRPPVVALQGAAPDHVAHTGSTSKTLAPGMRLGWLVPPPRLLDELVQARHDADLGSPALPQLVLARLLDSGDYDTHLRRVRRRQRLRRDAVVESVRRHLPRAEVTGVAAGLHVLVLLPHEVDDVTVAQRAASSGVIVHPLSRHRLRHDPQHRPGLVLGYAAHPPDRLDAAIRAIGEAIR